MEIAKAETVMITGASGHLGEETLLALSRKFRNVNVKVLIHPDTEVKADAKFAGANFEKVFSKSPGLESPESFQGVHSLFIIPPPVENRVQLVRNIVHAAKEAKVKFILAPAHLSVRQKDTVLARTFREIETEIQDSGIPHCFLHSELFMDVLLADADQIKRTSTFSSCIAPDVKYNPVATRDMGEVAAQILVHPGAHEDTRYTITGPRPLSLTDLAEIYTKVLGREIKYVQHGPELYERELVRRGVSPWFSRAMVELEQSITSQDEEFTSGDTMKLLGRHPVSFETFLQDRKSIFVQVVTG